MLQDRQHRLEAAAAGVQAAQMSVGQSERRVDDVLTPYSSSHYSSQCSSPSQVAVAAGSKHLRQHLKHKRFWNAGSSTPGGSGFDGSSPDGSRSGSVFWRVNSRGSSVASGSSAAGFQSGARILGFFGYDYAAGRKHSASDDTAFGLQPLRKEPAAATSH